MAATPPLSTEEVARLRQAQARLQAGDAAGAASIVEPLLAAGCRHPDALALHGLACRRLGRLEEARARFEAALRAGPGRGELWSSYGNLLGDLGEDEAALAALEKAVALSPQVAEAWMNLGLAASRAGRHSRATEALVTAAELAPRSAAVWGALGHAEQQAGSIEPAAQHLRKALSLDPRHLRSRHNLAVALRRLDQPEAALAETERAIADGLSAPQTLGTRGHLLADLGRFDEAVEQYQTLLGDHPDYLDAHEVLARLLPQIGRGGEAFDAYRRALQDRPDARALWLSALAAARDLKDAEQLKNLAAEARSRFGGEPELIVFEAIGHGLADDDSGALALLEPLAREGHAAALTHAAYFRLRQGDLRAAEQHALAATRLVPHVQSPWAYLTIIWRLLEDPREAWLADYERLAMPIWIEPEPVHAGPPEFLARLEEVLTSLHRTRMHPADQSLRSGTQTRGDLFDRREPLIQALAAAIGRQVGEALARLPRDPSHPFLSRNSGRIAFAGSWSVRLRDGGFHVSHIHQSGWLSSALYIALPPEIGAAEADQALPPGALLFGIPDPGLRLDLPPRRVELPAPGKLVIFPSYFWHGTAPFRSASPRLTVAFDALPA